MSSPVIRTLAGLLVSSLLLSCRGDAGDLPRRVGSSLSLTEVMGGEATEGFRRALEPRPFVFPADHGPHPGFRTEWWYVTGNLEGPSGELFGFQLTFFRSALAPEGREPTEGEGGPGGPDPEGPLIQSHPSAWQTNQIYMAHFAVTDGPGGEHRAFERFARSAVGLAGARVDPFRVWVEDWELLGPSENGLQKDGIFPLVLRASEGGTVLGLTLSPEKPLVLQGREGLSQKGPEAGNASYYYSFTRLDADGTLSLDGEETRVRGTAWMDREWSTSALSQEQVGWDWFALQLADGYDLMVYQLRDHLGEPHPLSAGIWVDPAGGTRGIEAQEMEVQVLERWESPVDGAVYPGRWRVAVPSLDLELEVIPLVPNQEMELTFRYWEGAVGVQGTRGGQEVMGRGYVELTGYASWDEAGPTERQISRTGG